MSKKLGKYILLINLLVCITLTGCLKGEGAFEGKAIDDKIMLDQKKFIEEGKERMKNTSEFGPEVEEMEDDTLRDANNFLINKEVIEGYVDETTSSSFPVDINVENIDIRTLTQMLAQVTGINFLVSEEVDGFVTAKLKDVPWPRALDSILNLKSLAKHVDTKANIIRIHNHETITKLEGFEKQRREKLQEIRLLSIASQPFYTEVFKLFYADPEAMKEILEEVLGIGEEDDDEDRTQFAEANTSQITVDTRMRQLIIKAHKEEIELAKNLIAKLDTRTKQVFIEAFIVEATDDFATALGTRVGGNFESSFDNFNVRSTGVAGTAGTAVAAGDNIATFSDLSAAGATSGISFLGGVQDAVDLKIELTALENKGLSKVISNPRLFTLDNQEAVIFQGTEVPFSTTSQDGTNVSFKEAGLKLTVTPVIVGDGNLLLTIDVDKDSVDLTKSLPPITKSTITTKLVTKDGSIVVIGGIYTQTKGSSKDGVPGLSDIPIAGKLFTRETKSDLRKELIIFIAPKII